MTNWSDKISVTSECPTCHKKWDHEVYLDMPMGVLAFTMCDSCVKENSDKNGNMLIQNNVQYKLTNKSNVDEILSYIKSVYDFI